MIKHICKFICKVSGWHLIGRPVGDKSVIVLAPHTSYWDGIWGYILLNAYGIKYKCVAAEWLFFWPMRYIMKYLMHGIPVGKSSANAIRVSVDEFKKSDSMHLVICPEGQLAPTNNWSPGCWLIAKKADVAINMYAIDYSRKLIILMDSYSNTEGLTKDAFMQKLKEEYTDYLTFGSPKHPEKFMLPK